MAEQENDNGARLRYIVGQCSLAAVNTFFDAGYSWRSSHDKTHRIDYICFSDHLLTGVTWSSAISDIE
eukprot:12264425-Heterocapsa_arctica.AAC.1